MNDTTNIYDAEVRRLRGHFKNCDGYTKVAELQSGLVRLRFTYLYPTRPAVTVTMDVSMDQIEEAENNPTK